MIERVAIGKATHLIRLVNKDEISHVHMHVQDEKWERISTSLTWRMFIQGELFCMGVLDGTIPLLPMSEHDLIPMLSSDALVLVSMGSTVNIGVTWCVVLTSKECINGFLLKEWCVRFLPHLQEGTMLEVFLVVVSHVEGYEWTHVFTADIPNPLKSTNRGPSIVLLFDWLWVFYFLLLFCFYLFTLLLVVHDSTAKSLSSRARRLLSTKAKFREVNNNTGKVALCSNVTHL